MGVLESVGVGVADAVGEAEGDEVGVADAVGEGVGVGVVDGATAGAPEPGQVCESLMSEFEFKMFAYVPA